MLVCIRPDVKISRWILDECGSLIPPATFQFTILKSHCHSNVISCWKVSPKIIRSQQAESAEYCSRVALRNKLTADSGCLRTGRFFVNVAAPEKQIRGLSTRSRVCWLSSRGEYGGARLKFGRPPLAISTLV
jgi:hypothetical protein